MKIDKHNPRHWMILIVSMAMLLLVIFPGRIAARVKKRKSIVLYGHKLNGNLLPYYEYGQTDDAEYAVYYLSLDPEYLGSIDEKHNILNGTNIFDLFKLASAAALITDHGPHHFVLLKKVTNMKFIDVWHGLPYKGFDEHSFSIKYYDEIWVSSPRMKKMWVDKFGFEKYKVTPVGCARVERLLSLRGQESRIRKKYGLANKKTVLIAPTWQQDDEGRSIIPFGMSLEEFVQIISKGNEDVQIIFRAHLNVKEKQDISNIASNVKIMSYADYPVGEDFLLVSDVVISDWSSIVFDFLPLNRPVIYLDVKPPFKLGFSIGPEYRFGEIVNDGENLRRAIRQAIDDPKKFQKRHKEVLEKSLQIAYGNTIDGKVIERSIKRLSDLTAN